MINYAVLYRIEDFLGEVSALHSRGASAGVYYQKACELLEKFKRFADDARLYVAADIALTLEDLLTYEGAPSDGRRNLRKERDAYAVRKMSSLVDTIKKFLDKDKTTAEECTDVCRQAVAGLLQKGLSTSELSDNAVAAVENLLKHDPDLVAYYTHILGRMGAVNTRVCLDNALAQLGVRS